MPKGMNNSGRASLELVLKILPTITALCFFWRIPQILWAFTDIFNTFIHHHWCSTTFLRNHCVVTVQKSSSNKRGAWNLSVAEGEVMGEVGSDMEPQAPFWRAGWEHSNISALKSTKESQRGRWEECEDMGTKVQAHAGQKINLQSRTSESKDNNVPKHEEK